MSEELSNKVNGVIFDFDETLVDSEKGYQGAWVKVAEYLTKLLEKSGIETKKEKLQKEVENVNLWMDRKSNYDRDKWWKKLLTEYTGETPSKKVLEKITDIYWEATMEGSELFPDAVSILEYLNNKNYSLGLLTDTDGRKGTKYKRIQRVNLEKWFDEIIIAGENVEKKPSTEPYYIACEQLSIPPKKCVFIGDKPFTDIKGANKAGMISILLRRRDWDLVSEPDYILDSLSEIKKIL